MTEDTKIMRFGSPSPKAGWRDLYAGMQGIVYVVGPPRFRSEARASHPKQVEVALITLDVPDTEWEQSRAAEIRTSYATAFEWLKDEPDLYTADDGEAV